MKPEKKEETLKNLLPFDARESSQQSLLLFDNVQFIYELALAQLELQALGVKFEVTNSLRKFDLIKANDIENLRRRTAYFKLIKGKYSDYFHIVKKNRTHSVNQYLTHWIYPYKGKFHPQMIRALLNIIEIAPGETVLDPFIGSGTTALEAQLLGINCIGVDVSPLCVLQSKVKTESLTVIDKIITLKEKSLYHIEPSLFSNEKGLVRFIEEIPESKVRNFYQMARLVALSDVARRKREFKKSFLRNLDLMIASVTDLYKVKEELNLTLGKVDIKIGDSRSLPLPDVSVDGIITSPPYSIALDYVSNDAHALKDLGFDLSKLRERFIGVRGKGKERIELYNKDILRVYREMHRVLKGDRFAVIIIGNATYQKDEIKTVEFTIEHMERFGFTMVKNIDKIIFGLYNIMQKENILIFKKTK